MKKIAGVKDLGIVLSPDKMDGKMYKYDGGGIRDIVVKQEVAGERKGWYYLFYDGAKPGKTPTSYWTICCARSLDLLNWEKVGPSIFASAITHPESNKDTYKDFCGVCSPWDFYADGKWHRFYLGADACNEEGVPSPHYYTLYAQGDTLEGPWKKRCEEEGGNKHICFPTSPEGAWDDLTVSPGEVLINPKWEKDKENQKKYLMIYSGSCGKGTVVGKRSLGIARTNDLTIADDYDKETGNFWEKDKNPIIPPEHDVENSTVYFEEETGTYYVFTNHIYGNAYTDAVWVYWTKDLDCWDPENKALVFDGTMGNWANGAIGFPSVIKKDNKTLYMFYDAVNGDGVGHLDRHIGVCEIALPIKTRD